MQDPCFYEYFVRWAGGFLNENILRDLRLINAIPLLFHSIKFDSETDRWIQQLMSSCQAGTVITAPTRPLCINVELEMPPNTSPVVIKALQRFSIIKPPRNSAAPPRIVVPIKEFPCQWERTATPVRGSELFPASKVLLKQCFPVELGFAVTVHKAEGRTMKHVVVALSHCNATGCNFSYAQVHVALSRVRSGDHMRLLLTGRHETDQWMSLLYINELRPDPAIKYFFGGFCQTNPEAPNIDWQTNEWSADRANSNFKRLMKIEEMPILPDLWEV